MNERTGIRLKRFKECAGIAIDRMACKENRPNWGAQKISGREICKVYEGSEAKDAILARLVSFPRALPLALRVSDFYGDSLVYRESRRLSSSFYQIQFSTGPIKLQSARIDLHLGTNRTVESLCHELLHLDLAIRGYPLPVRALVPGELVPHACQLLRMQAAASNLLGHEIIFPQFLKLGFLGKRFLSEACFLPNYNTLAMVHLKTQAYSECMNYPWWCLEYLSKWLSSRYGVEGPFADGVSSSLLWGSRIYPRMQERAQKMTALIESGLLNDRSGYPLFCNTLMDLMRLPQYNKWVTLEKGSKRPLVSEGLIRRGELILEDDEPNNT